jgi:hypothetical protein
MIGSIKAKLMENVGLLTHQLFDIAAISWDIGELIFPDFYVHYYHQNVLGRNVC